MERPFPTEPGWWWFRNTPNRDDERCDPIPVEIRRCYCRPGCEVLIAKIEPQVGKTLALSADVDCALLPGMFIAPIPDWRKCLEVAKEAKGDRDA